MGGKPIVAMLDTNIIIDIIDASRQDHVACKDLVAALLASDSTVCAASLSFRDAYYFGVKASRDEGATRRHIKSMTVWLSVLSVGAMDIGAALDSDEPDFEDGIIRACAERIGADIILTRDAGAFGSSSVRKVTPLEFASELGVGAT